MGQQGVAVSGDVVGVAARGGCRELEDDMRLYRVASALAASATVSALIYTVGAGVKFTAILGLG